MKPQINIDDFKAKLDKVSEIDFARLAAYIDGEGCITITTSPARGKKAITRNHNLLVTVTNTSVLLFDWITSTFGGRELVANSNHGKPNTKMCYRWMLSEIQSEEVLRRCLPYFIIKGEQARVALAFRNIKKWKYQELRNRRVTPEMLAARDEMYTRMRSLNSAKGFNRSKLGDPTFDDISVPEKDTDSIN
jgi:hypothetical protein